MNDSKFIEKLAEEIWDAGQISSIAEGITCVNLPWSTVTGKIRELYLAMASRAIDVVNQEIAYGTRVNLPVRIDQDKINQMKQDDAPLNHVLSQYELFPNNEQ